MYEELGVDQLIYAPLTLTLDQKHVLRSIETFGKHVLPQFDKDPVHSTTRQREAALAGAGGVAASLGARRWRHDASSATGPDRRRAGCPPPAAPIRSSIRRPRRSPGARRSARSTQVARGGARGARGVRARAVAAHDGGRARRAAARGGGARSREAAPGLVDLTIAETGALRPVAESQQVGAVALRLASTPSWRRSRRTTPRAAARRAGAAIAFGRRRARADRRRRLHHAVQLPDDELRRQDRPGARVRQHGRGEAGAGRSARRRRALPHRRRRCCRPASSTSSAARARRSARRSSTSPDVDMISFTGSTAVGLRIQEAAARRMKRTLLELGGKSPQIVFADADRDDGAARRRRRCGRSTAGRSASPARACWSRRRSTTSSPPRWSSARGALKIGDPREPGVVIGPLVSAAQRERVERYIARGVEEGATLACGGKRPAHLPTRLLRRADAVHRRAQRHDDRARGDLRAGDHGDPVPRRGGGDRARQRLRLRPLRLRLDGRHARAACASRARCAPARCRSTAERDESRRALRRLQALGHRTRRRAATRSTPTARLKYIGWTA